jgi:putative endonuclease
MPRQYYVYIMTNKPFGTLYVGMTNDLVRRTWEHREGMVEGFTSDFGLKTLVWYEIHGNAYEAIRREKAIKRWHRDWKVNLIQEKNAQWRDLYSAICG